MKTKKIKFEYIIPNQNLKSNSFLPVFIFLKIFNNLQIGWHYIVDIITIYSKVKDLPQDINILDAGGGDGPMQYLLLEMGYNVYNVDIYQKKNNSIIDKRYKTKYQTLNSYESSTYFEHLKNLDKEENFILSTKIKIYLKLFFLKIWKILFVKNNATGILYKITGNIVDMPEIENSKFDVTISVSVIEHINIEKTNTLINEIDRVTKSNGLILITTSGTNKDQSWFHEPSQGWCFSEKDLTEIFKIVKDCNLTPDYMLELYSKNKFLKNNLAKFHESSKNCGMPLGIYKPEYFPILISNDV